MKNKKNIVTLLSFAFIAIAILPLADEVLNHFVRRKNYQIYAYEAFNEKTEVVLMGTSRFAYSVNPNKLTRPTMSITVPFSTYQYLELLWKHISKTRAPNIKVAIVEWDVILMGGYYFNLSPEFSLQSVNFRYYNKPHAKDWFTNLNAAFRTMFPSLVEVRLTPRYFFQTYIDNPGDPNENYFVSAGYIPSESRESFHGTPDERHTKLNEKIKQTYFDGQMNSLISLLDDLRKKNIQIYFAQIPLHPTVRGKNFEDWDKIYEAAMSKVKAWQGNNPIPFLSFEDRDLLPEDYKDADHMNRWGTEKFTKKFDDKIRIL